MAATFSYPSRPDLPDLLTTHPDMDPEFVATHAAGVNATTTRRYSPASITPGVWVCEPVVRRGLAEPTLKAGGVAHRDRVVSR